MVLLLGTGCGGGSSSPAAPSRPSSALASGTSAIAIGQPATSSLFGISLADLASCLHGSADPACFSGARTSTRAVGAAATAPSAPLNLSATASGGTVTLTWTAPVSGDPVTTYVIEAGSSSGASNLANLVTNSTATTFSASGVGPGTYYVRVRAQNAGGVSGPSNESILIVGASACTSAPNPPSGLTSTGSGTTVTLTWTAPVGGCAPTGYVIEAGSASGLSDLANFNTGNIATTFSVADVAEGFYILRVRSANANGASAPSNEVPVSVTRAYVWPEVTAITPTSGPTTGGTPVTITGTGFGPGAIVKFNFIPATNVVIVSSTTITAITPPSTIAGPSYLLVTNSDGLSTMFRGFSYVATYDGTWTGTSYYAGYLPQRPGPSVRFQIVANAVVSMTIGPYTFWHCGISVSGRSLEFDAGVVPVTGAVGIFRFVYPFSSDPDRLEVFGVLGLGGSGSGTISFYDARCPAWESVEWTATRQ